MSASESPEILPTLTYPEVVTRLGGGAPSLPLFAHTGDRGSEIISCYVPAWCPLQRLDALQQAMQDAWPHLPRTLVLVQGVPMECLEISWRTHAPQKETSNA